MVWGAIKISTRAVQIKSDPVQNDIFKENRSFPVIMVIWRMGRVMEVWLSCYLVLLSNW